RAPSVRVDAQRHDVGVAGPLPRGCEHGAVETPLRLKDSRRVDQDDLTWPVEHNAANRPARGLRLMGYDGDFGAHHRVGEGGLAAIGRADQGDKAAAGVLLRRLTM